MRMLSAALAATVLVPLAVTGCAGTGGEATEQNSTGDKVTIEFWSNHPASSKAVEQSLIAKFEKANPNIKVKLTDAGKDYEEVAQKFNAALAGGSVPDVVVLSDVTWFNFALNNQLAPLDDLLKKADAKTEDFVPTLYDEYVFDGHHMAAPYSRSTPLFYYNKDMWAKAGLPDRGPKTWQEWNDDFAPKLKAANPQVAPLTVPNQYVDWYFQGMIWSLGGAYSKDWTMTMSEPASIAAGKFFQDQFSRGFFRADNESTAPFVAGQAAAMLESTGSLQAVTKDGKINLGTAFLPAPEGTAGCPTGGAGLAIPAKSPNQEAAARFIAFLTSADSTLEFSQATGYMPTRTSALNSDAEKAFLKKNPNLTTAIRQLPHTRKQDNARVFVPGGGLKLRAALEKVAQGADVEATFKAVDEALSQIIDSQITPKLKK